MDTLNFLNDVVNASLVSQPCRNASLEWVAERRKLRMECSDFVTTVLPVVAILKSARQNYEKEKHRAIYQKFAVDVSDKKVLFPLSEAYVIYFFLCLD